MRYLRPASAVCLLLALWALSIAPARGPRSWLRPLGSSGTVRILRFDASVGTLAPGQKAQLCYGVENARSVRISPWMRGVDPSVSRCLEIGPVRTTHYTIVAEGYDGAIAFRSLTLPVEPVPSPRGGFLRAQAHPQGEPLLKG
jgi:hypothetical protein